jgi:hypothetical protein
MESEVILAIVGVIVIPAVSLWGRGLTQRLQRIEQKIDKQNGYVFDHEGRISALEADADVL